MNYRYHEAICGSTFIVGIEESCRHMRDAVSRYGYRAAKNNITSKDSPQSAHQTNVGVLLPDLLNACCR